MLPVDCTYLFLDRITLFRVADLRILVKKIDIAFDYNQYNISCKTVTNFYSVPIFVWHLFIWASIYLSHWKIVLQIGELKQKMFLLRCFCVFFGVLYFFYITTSLCSLGCLIVRLLISRLLNVILVPYHVYRRMVFRNEIFYAFNLARLSKSVTSKILKLGGWFFLKMFKI